MSLSPSDTKHFYDLWYALVWGVNHRHGFAPKLVKPVFGTPADDEAIVEVRGHIWQNPRLIDEYIESHKNGALSEEDVAILSAWRANFISNRFIIYKHLVGYSIFMSADNPDKLYAVRGVGKPVKDTLAEAAPVMADAVLLPYRGCIVCDGVFTLYDIVFGKETKNSLRATYNRAKKEEGIIECIGEPPVSQTAEDAPAAKKTGVPKAMQPRYDEIARMITEFADEKLDAEYKDICLRALQKLCRKRPSPVANGKAASWACGIVYGVGQCNFIFDKSQPINMTSADIADRFGLSKNTASAKASEVRKLLNLTRNNTEFMLRAHIDNNPMIWNLVVNGLIVDIRSMPREVQLEAFYKGLIPYVPEV